MLENNSKNNIAAFAYKILNDILMLLVLSFFLLLVAESILPGVASAYISLTKIILAVLAVTAVIFYLGRKFNFMLPAAENKKSKLFAAFAVLLALLAIVSLYKFSLWEIIIIFPVTLAIFFYFYKIYFPDSFQN